MPETYLKIKRNIFYSNAFSEEKLKPQDTALKKLFLQKKTTNTTLHLTTTTASF